MRRIGALIAGAAVLVCGPVRALSAEAPELAIAGGLKAAAGVMGAPRPFVEIVCPYMQRQAEQRGLPPMPFVRLIWRESHFNPNAVSPKGAQGIAQFMPGTAEERGLQDPFEPISAIRHSASLLADLNRLFGNFGLAAAAYNAGEERVQGWLDGTRTLPGETRAYVQFVTGRIAEDWKEDGAELPEALRIEGNVVQDSCKKLAPLVVRAVFGAPGPLTASSRWRPWGVHVSTAFSKSKALAQYSRLKRAHARVLGDTEPYVFPKRNRSRGRRPLYMVQIGASSRSEATKICAALRRDGGACIVTKN
ncbi:lytic transglycosylase domain-containing protein [Methyloceanibacter methanicus]|uniref:lytic transglycosylase domain-containing protein n=1 Tax=Methyloceanibacter methanicus TaxID=1774968 RepID=UPI0008498EA9|nr:lytic transglycosylase domain-containing protein [Methyloceanibacter methanicus]